MESLNTKQGKEVKALLQSIVCGIMYNTDNEKLGIRKEIKGNAKKIGEWREVGVQKRPH